MEISGTDLTSQLDNRAPVVSFDIKDIKLIADAYKQLVYKEQEKYLHGLSYDEDDKWVATSIEFKTVAKSKYKWHCHGTGNTPLKAINDMLNQIETATMNKTIK